MSQPLGPPEVLCEGRFLRLVRRTVPGGVWEYAERVGVQDVVLMFAIDAQGRVPLVRQYRAPVQSEVWELPAGLCDTPEPMERTAIRELEEECGFTAHRVEHLMRAPASQGAASTLLDFYLLINLEPVEGVTGDEIFPIETHWVPLDGLEDFVMDRMAQGEMVDVRILAALRCAERRLRVKKDSVRGFSSLAGPET